VNDVALYIALYLDEDVTHNLALVLRERGYDVISAMDAGLLGYSDDKQLEYAISQGRAVLTYNGTDYVDLATEWFESGRAHPGIILSQQFSKQRFGELLRQVLKLLNSLTRDEMRNQVINLQSFK
jgi:predicted nuclease of predicted toxin-antitoxin system